MEINWFILYLIASIGLTNIIVNSKIRDLFTNSKLFAILSYIPKKIIPKDYFGVFDCHQCAGFWVGIFLGLLCFQIYDWRLFLFGGTSSLLADYGAMFVDYIMINCSVSVEEDK